MIKTISNNNILINRVYSFVGNRGSGKTMFASIFGGVGQYRQVFCNFDLELQNKKVYKYKDFDLYKKIDIDNLEKKLLIFDEGGINANARNFQSKINKLLSFFIFVSRKFNLDIVFISQNFETFDINIRRQTDFLLYFSNFLPKKIVVDIRKTYNGEKKMYYGGYDIKALEVMQLYNIKYNTRDLSGFEEKLKEYIIE